MAFQKLCVEYMYSVASVVSYSLQPVDYSSIGILQTRILEWVAVPFSNKEPLDESEGGE